MYDNDYTDYGYDIFNEDGENLNRRLAETQRKQQQQYNYYNRNQSPVPRKRVPAIAAARLSQNRKNDNTSKTKNNGDVNSHQNSQGQSSALKRGLLTSALTAGIGPGMIGAAYLLRNRKNHNAPKIKGAEDLRASEHEDPNKKFKEEDFEALKGRNKLYSSQSGLNNINRNQAPQEKSKPEQVDKQNVSGDVKPLHNRLGQVPQSDEQSQHQQDSEPNINPPSNDSDSGVWNATKWGLGTVAAAAIGYGGYKLIKHLVNKYKDKIANSKDSIQAKRAALNSIINDINVKISKATTEEEKDELIKARKELQKTLGEIK